MPYSNDLLPTALHSAAQVRDLDARLIAAGTPGFDLMERAAHAAWRALRRRWPQQQAVTVLAGHGNNAGDAYLLAALAQRAGWQVHCYAVGDPAKLAGDAASAHAAALQAGVTPHPWHDGATLLGVLVDGLLGTGLSGEVRAPYAQVIQQINAAGLPVLALDVPSGLCADTGMALGAAVRADLTVTFIGLKIGLFTGEAPALVGELVFDDLQADAEVVAQTAVTAQRLACANLPPLAPRLPTAHKGQFGQVLVVGGDRGFGGAALLTAQSALRCGAGMVSLATRPEHVPAALVRRPEIMSAGVSSANQLLALVKRATVLVVGPGLGQEAWGRSLFSVARSAELPQVWDADALNRLAAAPAPLPANCVITPHPGEAARLLSLSTAQVQANRPAAAHALAQKYAVVAVLKGAGSLIAAPDGRLSLCNHGHPAMAGAGLGDVLAGVIGALLAQGMPAFEAACLGVWLHARAGEQLGEQGRGLAASDLIGVIRGLLQEQSPCLS
ncbi:NAD(P)H-hydrate dehydratase [Pseudomonas turukhanskensis]|uniref:Bifunctional NAD(P)H-hydrate repair enzyme n=1 Tax=Pseudomonas turukhanskensis TaxID=1806536 RepID=A0A9W6K3L8_9PSED|nr:NAD(P)H-hydrate dehydratase [Pseudomonas turukhanskensis]GLK87648.1 bifunctional NAD(P)H-hydrate repair enzyme [Pseudomonas turukhanskensis]